MIRWNRLTIPLIVVAAASGSFVATYALQPAPDAEPATSAPVADATLTQWLGVDAAEAPTVTSLENAYCAERRTLKDALIAEREALANMFEDSEATGDEIRAQVERVIAASNTLERRTADFLLAVRPHLSAQQQQRLLNHFAKGVREGGRHRWRRGPDGGADDIERGGGPPSGRGPGRGRGGQRRGGEGEP